MKPLRTFRLEEYLGEWEFKVRYHLTASDAESITVEELLALGTDADREGLMKLPLSYIETWGTPGLREAVAGTYERVDADHVLAFAGAEEGAVLGDAGARGPGRPRRRDRALLSGDGDGDTGDRRGRERAGAAPRRRLGAGPRRAARPAAPDDEARRRQLPEQPDRLRPRRGDLSRAGGVVRRARHPAVLRRGLPWHRGRPGQDDHPGRRPFGDGGLAQRRLQVLRPPRPARRLARLPRPGAARAPGEAQALHVHLQCRSRRVPRRGRTPHREPIWARNRGIVAANRPLFDDFFARWSELFDWQPPVGGCVCFPRYKGGDVDDFCARLLDAEGVLVLPASMYYSEIADVPTDHFRVGIGRQGLEGGLAAFDRFLQRQN